MRRLLVAAALITCAAAISLTAYTQSTRIANTTGRAVYGPDQARRGKTLYTQNCSKSHMEIPQGNCPAESVRVSEPYVCAPLGGTPPLTGDPFLTCWCSTLAF